MSPAPAPPVWGAERDRHDVWPTRAQELLLRAALMPDERALEAWREVRPQVQVAELDGATQALLPPLRHNLVGLGVQDELLALFKGVHRYSWARNQLLLAPMLPVVDSLERSGIPTLLLKGAAFVADGRVDRGMRSMNDVDVLVPTDRLGQAVAHLSAHDLVPVGDVPPWYVTDYAPRFVASHGFCDAEDRQLDLHWHALHASCQPDADASFWQAAVDVELLGVRTRALCPTDELMLVIVHGLRWNETPTYRWVIDAALLASGAFGEVDYERLVRESRRRRLSVALHAGLSYLVKTANSPVPAATLRQLARDARSRLDRVAFDAQLTRPRHRGRLAQAVVLHELYLRRHLRLGEPARLGRRLRLERERLGVRTATDWRHTPRGVVPGPGRPVVETAAAIGTGRVPAGTPPVELGTVVNFADPTLTRRYVAYGMWRSEPEGCWIAGREACVALPLAGTAEKPLALEVSADGLLSVRRARQRLQLSVNGASVGTLVIDHQLAPRRAGVLLPRRVWEGASTLQIVLRAPDAAAPARLDLGDDDRSMGVYLRDLVVRELPTHRADRRVELSSVTPTGCVPLAGWHEPEEGGRWTGARLAELALRPADRQSLELEFDARPFLGRDRRPLRVEVQAGRRAIARLDLAERGVTRVRVPERAIGGEGLLVLGWRTLNPRVPRNEGHSDDGRLLGLFMHSLALRPG